MPVTLTSLRDLTSLPFDEIIDVRSPSEFALDHIPGAVNLPVLSDEERATVGTIYVQDDRFRARKIGAAMVSRNAARHLETHLAGKPGAYRPLVYCWRGGQRSGSFATILGQIGWRADTIEGGYQSYRRRLTRLGHISFFGLGFINFFFALSHQVAGIDAPLAQPAAIAFTIGAATMPTCCFLSAWRKPFRHFFFIPVASVSTGITLTLIGWPW